MKRRGSAGSIRKLKGEESTNVSSNGTTRDGERRMTDLILLMVRGCSWECEN